MASEEKISLVAALGRTTHVIGKDGELLWQIPDDLRRFKLLTLEHPVIMGRKTWESLPEKFRPLPGRTNIVVSRQSGYIAEGAEVCASFEDALEKARASEGAEEIFIIGGGELYTQALPVATNLYLTLVDDTADGDAYFPIYENDFQKITLAETHEYEGLEYEWLDLVRD